MIGTMQNGGAPMQTNIPTGPQRFNQNAQDVAGQAQSMFGGM